MSTEEEATVPPDLVSFPATGPRDDDGRRSMLEKRMQMEKRSRTSHVDPITARPADGCHRPLEGTRISNPVSVITAAETSW